MLRKFGTRFIYYNSHSLSLSLIILFTNVQNKNTYTYVKKYTEVKESNRGKLNSHIKTTIQNEKIKQLRIEN